MRQELEDNKRAQI